jgi:hypothetical protein
MDIPLGRRPTLKLPADYLAIITDGASALRSVGQALRGAAAQNSATPELWLSIRDVEGLADRIGWLPDEEWRAGAAHLLITGQDVGVLEELVANPAAVGYRSDAEATAKLARLHAFLRRYCAGEFEREKRQVNER